MVNSFGAWKGVEQGLKRLHGKILWTIGDGNKVRLGLNPWVPNIPNGIPQLKTEFNLLADHKVSSLILSDD